MIHRYTVREVISMVTVVIVKVGSSHQGTGHHVRVRKDLVLGRLPAVFVGWATCRRGVVAELGRILPKPHHETVVATRP